MFFSFLQETRSLQISFLVTGPRDVTSTHDSIVVGGFPLTRWHQTFDVGHVPNDIVSKVFMAVTLDLRDDPSK